MAIWWWISILVIMNAMNSYLAIPKGTVMTIEKEEGEVAYCVDVYQQPAFTNPFLHNHSLQMKPTKTPRVLKLNDSSPKSTRMQVQTWPCLNGTVPILRWTLNSSFGSNYDPHKYAVVDDHKPQSDAFRVSTTVDAWSLRARNQEASVTKVGITNDVEEPTEAIEAGWMINPHHTDGPMAPSIFVYFRNDGYPKGCYNLDCDGFVLTNQRFGLGSRVLPSSKCEINMAIMKDMTTGNWWFYYEYHPVGYWPRELFDRMGPRDSDKEVDIGRAGGNVVRCGGEIVERVDSDHPTRTQMGNQGETTYKTVPLHVTVGPRPTSYE